MSLSRVGTLMSADFADFRRRAFFWVWGFVLLVVAVAHTEGGGTSERALFVIDGAGMIRWSYKSPMGVNPGADGILEALESMAEAKA